MDRLIHDLFFAGLTHLSIIIIHHQKDVGAIVHLYFDLI